MVALFSWFYRNPWAIVLLACIVAGVIFKDGVVKTVALLHPLKHEEAHKATIKHADKVLTRETKFPDGKVVTETLTDKSVTDTHADSKRDEKPQVVSNGGLWAEAGYGVMDGRWHGGISATYGPFMAGVENPVALEFAPKVKAGLRVIQW